jgi:hypothetical protein
MAQTEWLKQAKEEQNIVARIDMRKSADIRVAYQNSKAYAEGWERTFGKRADDAGRKSGNPG